MQGGFAEVSTLASLLFGSSAFCRILPCQGQLISSLFPAFSDARVAQLVRATGLHPVGRGFESLLAHHFARRFTLLRKAICQHAPRWRDEKPQGVRRSDLRSEDGMTRSVSPKDFNRSRFNPIPPRTPFHSQANLTKNGNVPQY